MNKKIFLQNISVELEKLLIDYTEWLVKNGYVDCDAIFEEPKAVDEYLKETN